MKFISNKEGYLLFCFVSFFLTFPNDMMCTILELKKKKNLSFLDTIYALWFDSSRLHMQVLCYLN